MQAADGLPEADIAAATPVAHGFSTSATEPVSKDVAPFLSKHIPDQYSSAPPAKDTTAPQANTRFCYRHRPDLKCRRQADEMTMDHLQKVCSLFDCLVAESLYLDFILISNVTPCLHVCFCFFFFFITLR